MATECFGENGKQENGAHLVVYQIQIYTDTVGRFGQMIARLNLKQLVVFAIDWNVDYFFLNCRIETRKIKKNPLHSFRGGCSMFVCTGNNTMDIMSQFFFMRPDGLKGA